MWYRALAVAAVAVLGSCSVSPDRQPSNTENACLIIDENPSWYKAAKTVEQKWGTPAEVTFAIIWRESSFRARAQTPRTYSLWVVPTGRVSSAYGYAQAIDGTWDWYLKDTGNRRASRDNFSDAADFVGWYTNKTRTTNGIPLGDAFRQYLAYHEGHTGYRRGSYQEKAWLLKAAGQVRDQASRYARQLSTCT